MHSFFQGEFSKLLPCVRKLMSCVKKLTLIILTGQKFSLSVKFVGADSINLKFAINLIFGINVGNNFSQNLSKFFDISLLKFSQKFLPRSVQKDL